MAFERGRQLIVFALLSLVAVACGAATMALAGFGPATFLQNFAAWFVGIFLALFLPSGTISARLSRAALPVCIILLAASFLGLEQSGVHRWIGFGPVRANAAALILPVAIISLVSRQDSAASKAVTAIGIMAILCLQPDASQATAFAGAACIIVGASSGWQRYPALAVILGLTIISWVRPDPLQPVDIVEDILTLAWHKAPLLACTAIAALIGTCLMPWLKFRNKAAMALSAYFALLCLTTLFGHFPVPLVGLGLSFPLGWWLGYALLLRQASANSGISRA